jgi:glutamine amidotransferase-like uncharacterized protein
MSKTFYKRFFFVTALISTLCSTLIFATELANRAYVLVYNGRVADADGVKKVAQMAKEKGYDVKFISNLNRLPEMLTGAVCFIIGGTVGDTGELLESISDSREALMNFIKKGGRYLGICGGAYIASKGSQWPDGYEVGLGLVDCESFEYDPKYSDAQIISIEWRGSNRTIYYLNGPAFAKNKIPANSTVLAYYTNANKDVAAFSTILGKGRIVLCGPHPEADETWLIDDPRPLYASKWRATWDIFSGLFDTLFVK